MPVTVFSGSVAADLSAHLPPNTLSEIVYLYGLLRANDFTLLTPLCQKECAVLFNPDASGVELRATALGFSDGIFDLQSEVDAA